MFWEFFFAALLAHAVVGVISAIRDLIAVFILPQK